MRTARDNLGAHGVSVHESKRGLRGGLVTGVNILHRAPCFAKTVVMVVSRVRRLIRLQRREDGGT